MISPIGRIGALLACLVAGTATAATSSVLNFPRLAAEAGTLTGVAMVNPSAELARVSLTAFGAEGDVIGRGDLEIPAGRQVGFLTSDVFPDLDPATVGWFQATSETSGLTGFYLFLTLAGDQFDGADLPPPARRIVFPRVRIGGGHSTELNVVNPGQRRATVRISLLGGPAPMVAEIALQPNGAARLDAATLFGAAEAPPGAYALAESAEDLLGFELVRLEGQDLVGLNARVADDLLNTIYFPQFAAAGEVRSELTLVNGSSRAVTVEAVAHQPDGTLLPAAAGNPRQLELAPGESRVEDLADLFGFAGAQVEGWLEVRAPSSAINGSISYRLEGSGAAASVASVARGSRRAIFSHIATTQGFFTGIAILNPNAAPAAVTVIPMTADGRSLGRVNTVLRPGERISRLISQIIPSSAGQAGGFIFIASSRPVFLTSLFGTLEGSVLANIPPQPAPLDFEPLPNFGLGGIAPAWAALPPSGTQAFETVDFPSGANWSVSLPGASQSAAGSIDSAGLYQAPMAVPSALPVTVTARGIRTAAAAVDILMAEPLANGTGVVEGLAFLPGSQRLFSILSFTPPGANPSGAGEPFTNAVYEIVPPDGRELLADFGSDRISSLVGLRSIDGVEFLVAAAQSSGRLLRIDPTSGDTVELAAGLEAPAALAADPFTGNLLLAEADRISRLSRFSLLESPPSSSLARRMFPPPGTSIGVAAQAAGVAVNQCSGNVFFSETATGRILEYVRSGGEIRVAAEGLSGPGRLVALYRRGLGCPFGFHLMVIQEPGQGVALVVPEEGVIVNPWLAGSGLDLAPLASETGLIDALASAEAPAGDGLVLRTEVEGLFSAVPINPPQVNSVSAGAPPGPDLEIGSAVLRAGDSITLPVRFRPAAPAGALVFSIDWDRARLSFDPADGNADGVPDAIESNLPPDYFFGVRFDPEAEEGIGFVIVDSEAPLTAIPEGPLLNVTFTVLDTAGAGSADVVFATAPDISVAGVQAEPQPLDESIAGVVTVIR